MPRVALSVATNYISRILGGVFSDADINLALNDGYKIFCRATGVLFVRSTASGIQDIAHQATYTLPTDVAEVQRVSYRGITIPPLRSEQLVNVDAVALSQEGTVIGYLLDGDGVTKLRKYLIPAVTDTGSNTAIEYEALPTTLDSNTAFQVPPYMMRCVIWYALYRLLRRNGVAQDLKFADHFYQRYLACVGRIVKRKSKFLSRRTGVLGGGPTTRRIPRGPRLPWNYGTVVR